MSSSVPPERKKILKIVLIINLCGSAAVIAAAVLLFMLNIKDPAQRIIQKNNISASKTESASEQENLEMFDGWINKLPGKYTVGEKIRMNDIKEFYFTYDSSTNPPYFQRYKLSVKDGSYFFYHEKREGDHWPLTEKDVTVSGTKELSKEEFLKFYSLLEGGKVERRSEHLEAGGAGPWMFLYWNGDMNDYQEYEFESYGKRTDFEKLCREMSGSAD